MNNALVGVVVVFPVKVVGEFLPRPVSGCGNGGLALAAGYDFDTAIVANSFEQIAKESKFME